IRRRDLHPTCRFNKDVRKWLSPFYLLACHNDREKVFKANHVECLGYHRQNSTGRDRDLGAERNFACKIGYFQDRTRFGDALDIKKFLLLRDQFGFEVGAKFIIEDLNDFDAWNSPKTVKQVFGEMAAVRLNRVRPRSIVNRHRVRQSAVTIENIAGITLFRWRK